MNLAGRIKEWAGDIGFDLVGIAPAGEAATRAAYEDWVAAGRAGEMGYMARNPGRRVDPRQAWPSTASVVVVGLNYRSDDAASSDGCGGPRGRVACYAMGDDYHEVMAAGLRRLLERIQAWDGSISGRIYVDTGPLLERDLAARAGLGWFGKNTMLLNRRMGSYFFLGALLLDVELSADQPTSAHCGRCARCLEACPTGAFVAPYVLDARRCISYLTIELKGPIPRELRPMVGTWVFGCDVCQEVCPWNRRAPTTGERAFAPRPGWSAPELLPLLRITPAEFAAQFRRSPVKRAKRRGLVRNVCVALGNLRDPSALTGLCDALGHDEALARGHAAWALGRLGGGVARQALGDSLRTETDPWVREEVELALACSAAARASS
jgi:epoxyqueuosine reductase